LVPFLEKDDQGRLSFTDDAEEAKEVGVEGWGGGSLGMESVFHNIMRNGAVKK
jgi:hypothetical protein